MRTYIGIDPGAIGAIGWIGEDHTANVVQMPALEDKVDYYTLKQIIRPEPDPDGDDLRVAVEAAWLNPKLFRASACCLEASATIYGICLGMGVSVQVVRPQDWKAAVLRGRDWKKRKAASLEYAREKYPLLNWTCKTKIDVERAIGRADALCIAEYAALDAMHERSKV